MVKLVKMLKVVKGMDEGVDGVGWLGGVVGGRRKVNWKGRELS